jgi:hypothetical protein
VFGNLPLMDQWALNIGDACERSSFRAAQDYLAEGTENWWVRTTSVLLVALSRQAEALAVLQASGWVPNEDGVDTYEQNAAGTTKVRLHTTRTSLAFVL